MYPSTQQASKSPWPLMQATPPRTALWGRALGAQVKAPVRTGLSQGQGPTHILTCVHPCQGVLLRAQAVSSRGQGRRRAGATSAVGVTAVQVLVCIPVGECAVKGRRLPGTPTLPSPGPWSPLHARGSRRAIFPPAQPRLLGEVVVALRLLPQVVVLHTLAHGPGAHLRDSRCVTSAPRRAETGPGTATLGQSKTPPAAPVTRFQPARGTSPHLK